MNEVEILSVGEHRKKLSCVWSRIKSTTIGANDAAPGSRDEAVVHSEDLMVSEPDRHLKWMSRLTTSMKLSMYLFSRPQDFDK